MNVDLITLNLEANTVDPARSEPWDRGGREGVRGRHGGGGGGGGRERGRDRERHREGDTERDPLPKK